MEKTIVAKVTENLLDKYVLEDENGNRLEAILTGNAKKKSNILIGDMVECSKNGDVYTIHNVLIRKNMLIRPPVANIDILVIVISITSPKPDYILLDKQLLICKSKNIKPIICINKIDLLNSDTEAKLELEYIQKVYGKLEIDIVYTSTLKQEGIEELKKLLNGKTSAFSGNSGVGKSSIAKEMINKVMNEEILTGNVSKKTNKGKHTTKYIKLYHLDNQTYILDTPGFSSYELYDIDYKELSTFYAEFNEIKCDFEDCRHVNEDSKVCSIKRQVNEGMIDRGRYERYVYLYNKLKEIDDRKYKR
ncbi:MAG: ribosome small subunit-dependent GTPase A [Clostridia bacterium]|nr:ribosome small subunit-dependent GTPase A [Clostridia bacterium]